jgi:hypothetical protein
MMSEEYYYYKERCSELESELAAAKKTIVKLNGILYAVQTAVRSRNVADTPSVLESIAYIVYGWEK